MKHTEGPWKVENEQVLKINQHGVEFVVCDLIDCINPSNDVHLIAAAPEMLEALEFVLKKWSPPEVETEIGMFPDEDEVDKIITLLKKAKGE